jgi:uncharacterized FAD-dependent dehydrogenase
MKVEMNYDIGIIGAGVAGVFAALRLAEKYKNVKAIVFEFGPPPPNCLRQDPIKIKRRRRQLEGWFGCFPTGDGKLYVQDDTQKLCDIADTRKTKTISKWFSDQIEAVNSDKVIITKNVSNNIKKHAEGLGFVYSNHSYQQWSPDKIHQLSKISADKIDSSGNIELSFDNEVFDFIKKNNHFQVNTSSGEFNCKKLIICTGRSGWRWTNNIFKKLGIHVEDTVSSYGVRVEMPSSIMKDFNKSHCSFTRQDIKVGPLCWYGSIIQEDHADLTTAAFRSNEDRWKTDKVFFSVRKYTNIALDGIKNTERVAKLAFLLSGDRVGREKIKKFLKSESQIGLVPEYAGFQEIFSELEVFIPNIVSRGYLHIPDIETVTSKINIASNCETEIDGLFVAGESAGVSGLAAAGIMGALAVEGALK